MMTAKTTNERQTARRTKLNQIAQNAGFGSWTKLETSVIKGEIEMNATFKTMQDAIDAGYTPVNRHADKDISGHNSFGYHYRDTGGNETVTVWFTDEPTLDGKISKYGSFLPMYPPK